MKKIILILLYITISNVHTLIMNVLDNGDNTITVSGNFNTGQSAAGAMIKLESLVTEKVLYKKRLPEESELIIKIPKEPYQIILDGGPRHKIIKKGIAPKEGFPKDLEIKKELSKIEDNNINISNGIILIFLNLCLIIFILGVYFSFKNTNKIIEELKKNS